MNYSFVIRRATVEDAVHIQGILQEAFKKYKEDTGLPGTPEALEESLETIAADIRTKEVFIGFIDDAPVGTVRVEILPDGTAYITRFGVSLSYHNIGIGKSLMNLVDKLVKARGLHRASLHTASKYKDLVRFYYGRGFYVYSTSEDRGYVRAYMIKDYE